MSTATGADGPEEQKQPRAHEQKVEAGGSSSRQGG